MSGDAYTVRQQLHSDLAELASRYIEHHEGRDLDGLAALGEDLLRLADCTKGRTSWLALLTRLQRLSVKGYPDLSVFPVSESASGILE